MFVGQGFWRNVPESFFDAYAATSSELILLAKMVP